MWQDLLNSLQKGDIKSLARSISLVENEMPGYEQLLQTLPGNAATKKSCGLLWQLLFFDKTKTG